MPEKLKWQILVPVRGGAASKTRLTGAALGTETRVQLARAFASDVAAAVLATSGVARLTIITRDAETAQYFSGRGASIFTETKGAGLNGAVRDASDHLRHTQPGYGIAALMGDLPGLTSEALREALDHAEALERGVLADFDGTGTTLLTATGGASLRPSYGAGSYARHVAAGHRPITVSASSALRRDVDTLQDLAEVTRLGLGMFTRELLAKIELRG